MIDAPPPPARARLGGLAALPLLAVLLAACDEAKTAPEPMPPVVQVTHAVFAPDVDVRRYVGTVDARREAAQAFRIGGRIVERLVDVGDRVAAGQAIARLDPRDLDLSVGSAEAELAAAKAAVAQTSAAEARGRRLNDANYASSADYDQRRLALEEARGRLSRAEQQLELARNQRAYATLTASAEGVVTAVGAEAGQVVTAGQMIASVAELGELEVAVSIPESAVGELAKADAAVTLWAEGSHRYRARLREVAPEADPTARTYAARFSIVDADAAVWLGMTATVELTRGDGVPVVRLPSSAIFNQGSGPGVFVVDPKSSRLELSPVEVRRYGGEEAVIAGGVPDGAMVVTLGVSRLEPGLGVRIAER